MKIKVYGYYNYDNIHDNREHITVTPIKEIEETSYHDYSGNVYEFEVNGNYKYGKKYDKYAECELDYFINLDSRYQIQCNPDKFGYVQYCVISKNGFAYLIPDIGYLPPENAWTNLGNLKAHKVKE